MKIKGSASVIDEIESINVATIDETEIMSDGSTVYELSLPDGVTAISDSRNVRVDIHHKQTTVRVFSVKNFKLENEESGRTYEFASDSVNVTLRGSIGEYFSYFSADDITVILDLNNYRGITGGITVPAKIQINNGSPSNIYALGSYSVHLTVS